MRIPRAGGAVQTLATHQLSPYQIVPAADGYVYWTNYGGGGFPGSVMRVRPGASPTLVAATTHNAQRLATDGVYVYFTEYDFTARHGNVRRARIGGSTVDTLYAAPGSARDVAVDATHVYFSDDAAIYRLPR